MATDKNAASAAPAPVATPDPAAVAAAEAAKVQAAQLKKDEAAKKKAEKADQLKAEKEKKAAEKAAEKTKKEAEKAEKAQAKIDAKAAAEAKKEADRMPEQNGIRRPKPDTLCGKAWAIFDEISKKNGAAASIGESLKVAETQGLNIGNVRAEYARWRKYFGVSGRVADPTAVVAAPTTPAPAAGEAK